MKTKYLIILLLSIGLFSCDKNVSQEKENPNNGENDSIVVDTCHWEIISPIALFESDAFCNEVPNLAHIFSGENPLMEEIKQDSLVVVINNEQDFEKICDYCQLYGVRYPIDYPEQNIVWGKVLTSSASDRIVEQQLSICSNSSLPAYKYEVVIEKCSECDKSPHYLYFWEIFPKKTDIENITLVVREAEEEGKNIVPVTIGKDITYSSEVIPRQDRVIKSQNEWETLLEEINSYMTNRDIYGLITEREIDFSNYQVIAVIDKPRSNRATVTVTDVREYHDKIVVSIVHSVGDATQPSQPFHFVKIPVSDKEIVFKHLI